MVLSHFPRGLYKRLLRAAKVIDTTNSQQSQLPFESLLCGKPSTLYSYELKQNVEIGTCSYSLYDRLVSIMNDGEYSSPIHTYPISFYSIVRNTTKLCIKSCKITDNEKSRFSIFSNQCQDLTRPQSELIEIVNHFELLAAIANKYNKSEKSNKLQQNKSMITDINSSKTTLQCDTYAIDWNNKQFSDKDVQMEIINLLLNKNTNGRNNNKEVDFNKQKQKKNIKPILEFSPKTLQSTNDKASVWRNGILFQHPLAALSMSNNNNTKIEPYVLLNLFAHSTHSTHSTSRNHDKNNIRIALIMNGEKTLLQVKDIIDGIQTVPDMFSDNNIFIGGDDLSTIEVLTNNPYCKGVGIMNNKLFWNPDLQIAERIIHSGYGTIDQFRFFIGKMKWNSDLWNNIQERNLYGFLSTARNTSASCTQLAKQIWSYHSSDNNSLWYQLLELCWESQAKDIESWMQLFNLINQHPNLKHEIHQLMQIHDAKIAKQVQCWTKKQEYS